MSFQPVIPLGGMAGWAFLQRTQDSQKEAFAASPVMQRDIAYFQENISKVSTAEQLVEDFRLLKVALGAYGLDDDIGNKYFIQKVLEDGTLDTDDLSNKLSDKRYYEMARDFGFGDYKIPRTKISDFGDITTAAYKDRQFEIAVGEQDPNLRLSMALERDLGDIVKKTTSDVGKWYSVMGNPPLRNIFETAFGLPKSFGTLDLELQLDSFREKAETYFGDSTIEQFSDPAKMEELNRLFLVRSEIANGTAGLSSSSIALTLLQNL
ncbi:DUF1217 domain-containing protein [Aliiroseovarius crassostreae]|uniref:DUF1217 domain-containing protein n=1 Tax=Aliiroseovarius crassostreae TaxID=154981 RepID=UPI003C7C61A1